jgi:cytochrome c-type biogenesis protein CcmH
MPAAPLFWMIALALVAGTVAALVWPLLRTRSATGTTPASATDIYRDEKREVDADWSAGAITREEREASVDELAARLGAELDADETPVRRPTRISHGSAVVVAAVVPVAALALYAVFGNPGAMQTTARDRAPKSEADIVAMVEQLASRMRQRPEDPTGWRLLARAYLAMARYPEAIAAFQQAATRGPEDASLLADWADAVAMRNQSLQGEAQDLVARALKLDPNDPKALSLSASAALERKDYGAAIAQWRKLQSQFPPGSEPATEIGAMIAEADAAKRGASPAAQAAAAATIAGTVSLDPKLRERVTSTDTLFIFARAVDGSRMPLAVVRGTAGELPRAFTLDDSMAMTPAARLSGASAVVVEARISKSGQATPAPGDLQGRSAPVKPGAQRLSIVIGDVVQ